MLKMTRRGFLGSAVAATVCSQIGFTKEAKLRIGVTDWNLDLGANPAAVPLAKKLGFDGVQVSFGRQLVDGKDACRQSGGDSPVSQPFPTI